MSLYECEEGVTAIISKLDTNDEEFRDFLFSLGCYEGEEITIITKKKHGMVIAVKDGRYNIDKEIAKFIQIA